MTMPICPIHRAVMPLSADGKHVCRRNPDHTFQVLAGPPPAQTGAAHCTGNMACPDLTCGGEMVQEHPGMWRCANDPRHVFRVALPKAPPAAMRGAAQHKRLTQAVEVALRESNPSHTAPVHWLAHIGLTTALQPPVVSNAGDGTYCQPLGDIAPGGGSKSGRKRKKPKKAPPLEPWGA